MRTKNTLHWIVYLSVALLIPYLGWAGADKNAKISNNPYVAKTQAKKDATLKTQPKKTAMKQLVSADAAVPTLYGFLVWSDEWLSMSASDYKYGIYSFLANEDTSKTLVYSSTESALTGALVGDEYYYITRKISSNSNIESMQLHVLNVETWSEVMVVDLENDYSAMPLVMTYDKTADTMYALSYSADYKDHVLTTMDLDTGELTEVANMGRTENISSIFTMSVAADGTMYTICADGNLYKLDKSSGKMTVVGSTGVSPSALQSTVYDYSTNTLYWAASLTDYSGKLYKVDTSTGVATLISDFENNEEYVGLFILNKEQNSAAPKAPEATFEFTVNGGLSGELSFTAPTSTVGGDALQGDITMVVKVDNEEVKSVSVAPGSKNKEMLTFVEGSHLISVEASSNSQISDKTYISIYAGVDSPKPVKNLTLSIEEGTAKLTWDAVSETVHGGYCPDMDKILYKVIRGDGSVAAESLSVSTFSEKLSDEISTHSYSVVAVAGGVESEASLSNEVRYGLYYTVPYFNDFNDKAIVDEDFTFINANNDGEWYTWVCESNMDSKGNMLIYSCNWTIKADDYAVLPKIKFENENLYELTFEHSVNGQYDSHINDIKVLAGKEAKIESLTTEIADLKDISNAKAKTSVIFALPDDDVYNLAYYIYSSAGQGQFWINDMNIEVYGSAKVPSKTDVTVTANGDETVSVEFVAPNKNAAGNTLESLSKISIYRQGETEACHIIENPTMGQKYNWVDESPTGGMACYEVVSTNSYGDSFVSEGRIFTGCYVTPYVESFNLQESFDLFKVIDSNNDGYTWKFNENLGVVKWTTNFSLDADDWLISPKVKFETGRVYRVGFKGNSSNYSKERIDITIGEDNQPASHKAILQLENFKNEEVKYYYGYYIPEKAGNYNVGLHVRSLKATEEIVIDELSVIDAMSIDAPDAVTDLKIESDETGDLKATVSFTTPIQTIGGEELTSLRKVDVYRNSETAPAYTFKMPKVGQSYSWTDEKASRGENTYRLVPGNIDGEGMDIEGSVYVGFDRPMPVTNLVVKGDATNANATLSWDAPDKGINGGRLNVEKLRYKVIRSGSTINNNVTETTFSDKNAYEGLQQTFYYNVVAVTPDGESEYASSEVVLGTPYELPFEETFTNWKYDYNPWPTHTYEGTGSFGLNTELDGMTGYDETGFMVCQKWDDEHLLCELSTPKISIKDAENPVVSFYMLHFRNRSDKDNLKLFVELDDNNERIPISDAIYVKSTEGGWVQHSVSLKDYMDCNYLQIVMQGDLYDNKIFIDNVSVLDMVEYNLCVDSFVGPDVIDNKAEELTAIVKNLGAKIVESYEVELYCNDELVETKSGSNLGVQSTQEFKFEIAKPGVVDAGITRNYYVKIVFSEDMIEEDNISEILVIDVLAPPYPLIDDLTATAGDDGVVNLSWSEPETEYSNETFDGFDTYELFATSNIGNWTLVDVDKQYTIAPRYGATFTDCFTPKAWQVGEAQRMGMSNESKDVAARSGSYFLFSMQSDGTASDGTATTPRNDDWLISEEIVGGTQFTFYAKQPTNKYDGNEKFEVLYSKTDKEVDSFILIESVELQNMAEWNEYSYTLPEDAKYFAIRHTESYFGLWLDDIIYTPKSLNVSLQIDGYNIYRNGIKIGESATTSYQDIDLNGRFKYAVSTRFDEGESALSNEIEITVTGGSVGFVNLDNPSVVGTHKFIEVKNADGMIINVFSVDGKLYHSEKATDSVKIPVERGIYVVKVGNYTRKVNVR